jgi:hypothetical protein
MERPIRWGNRFANECENEPGSSILITPLWVWGESLQMRQHDCSLVRALNQRNLRYSWSPVLQKLWSKYLYVESNQMEEDFGQNLSPERRKQYWL